MAHLCSLLTILPWLRAAFLNLVSQVRILLGALCAAELCARDAAIVLGDRLRSRGSSRSRAVTPAMRARLPEHNHELRAATVGRIWLRPRCSIDSGLQAPAAPGNRAR